MANASLQGNVAQELARRRVTEELLPRQDRLNDQYGPPEIPIPDNVMPYQTFEQPSDDVAGFFYPNQGGSPDASAVPMGEGDAAPGSGVPSAVANANAISNAVDSPLGMIAAALAPMGVPIAMALNAQANSTLDAYNAEQAAAEAAVPLDAFGPVSGDTSAAIDGASAMSAMGIGYGDGGDGGGGGGGGGGGKIVCTAMNQAYGFGTFRQSVWLEYSAKRLTKQHERGYHRIFRPLVRYAFHSGNSLAKRNVRRFLEYIMRLRTADIRAEMRGKNTHPIRRVVRRVCEYICYLAGKS